MENVREGNLKTADHTWKVVSYVFGALLLFFFSLDMMISSFQHLGRDNIQTIINATTNPFTGLFIGLLITAMIQSSSTTTALAVALVASGSLTLQSAVPIIMGANVGTTITSTIVSLGFIGKKKEFKRAVAAGTYHCFFNLLTLVVLFPLENNYGILSDLSSWMANLFLNGDVKLTSSSSMSWTRLDPVINFLLEYIPGLVVIIISFALLFGSILVFRKVISDLLKANSPEAFSRFFFHNQFKSFSWGLLTTAAIRSSTITTSVVVPVVAKKITTLRFAAPFIMGANVGTTITAFIAAALNGAASAMSLAVAHFLFNVIGVLIFFPIAPLREIPIKLANGLGTLTLRYPLACFVFLLLTFFIIPFSLIYFNQQHPATMRLTYEIREARKINYQRIVTRMNVKEGTGDWSVFPGSEPVSGESPAAIFPLRVVGSSVLIGKDLYLFDKPGSCWDGENDNGKYETCVQAKTDTFKVGDVRFRSVYIFMTRRLNNGDSSKVRWYFDSDQFVMLKSEQLNTSDSVVRSETLVTINR